MNTTTLSGGPTTARSADALTTRTSTAPESASPAELPAPGRNVSGPGAASFSLLRWAATRLSACAAFILLVWWASDAPLWLVGVGLGPFFIFGLTIDLALRRLFVDFVAEEEGGPNADSSR